MKNQRNIQHYAVFVAGKDRPGIVAAISEGLYHLGCNIADSSCAMLAGEFAMILIVSHSRPFSKTRLLKELKPICERWDMSLAAYALSQGEASRGEATGEICLVSLYGADQSGIVFRVTRELAQHGISITDLSTKLIGSQEEPVYVMMIEAVLPEDQTPEQLENLLENLKKELNVEISVRAVTPVSL